MKAVEVNVVAIRDSETVSATIIQEQKRGDGWSRMKAWDVTSGTPEAKRRVLLEDNERIVIEGRANSKVVYDYNQKAAVVVPSDPEKAEDLKTADEKIRAMNIEAEEHHRQQAAADAQKKAAEVPKTNLGNPIPPASPHPALVKSAPVAAAKPAAPTAPVKPATPAAPITSGVK